MDAILPKHPMAYRQIITTSIKLYKKSFTKVILLSFLLAITVFIPRFLTILVGQDMYLQVSPLSPHRSWFILIDLVSLIFFIGILWHMHCLAVRKHEPLMEDVYVGLKKVIYVSIASLIHSAIMFAVIAIVFGMQILLHANDFSINFDLVTILWISILFFCQFLLIAYISTLFIFYLPIIAIEGLGVLKGLEKSVLLVWNHWWRTISVQATPWLCYALLLVILKFFFRIDIHIYFFDHQSHPLWVSILNLIIFACFIPWVAAVLLVQLNDLELRRKQALLKK